MPLWRARLRENLPRSPPGSPRAVSRAKPGIRQPLPPASGGTPPNLRPAVHSRMPTRNPASRTVNRRTAPGNGIPRVPRNQYLKSRKEETSHGSCHPYVKNRVAPDVYSAGNAAQIGHPASSVAPAEAADFRTVLKNQSAPDAATSSLPQRPRCFDSFDNQPRSRRLPLRLPLTVTIGTRSRPGMPPARYTPATGAHPVMAPHRRIPFGANPWATRRQRQPDPTAVYSFNPVLLSRPRRQRPRWRRCWAARWWP